MTSVAQLALGACLAVVGGVLLHAHPDDEFLGLRGQPLGVVLVVVGLVDVGEALLRRIRGRTRRTDQR